MLSSIIFIPTYNIGTEGKQFFTVLQSAVQRLTPLARIVVVDSSSPDQTAQLASQFVDTVQVIPTSQFNHGSTRNLALDYAREANAEVMVFLTQDALLSRTDALEKIIAVFAKDPKIAAAYGRQLPHDDATGIASHARLFNYKEDSYVYGKEDIPKVGLKTVFMSNSFSAYRTAVFAELGGFPANTILGEDMYFAAKAVLAGYKVAYAADAVVQHSHNYTIKEEFKRYFDIGVFHCDEPWIRASFGGATGEGKRFVLSELNYLKAHNPAELPRAIVNTFAKFLGFKLGLNYQRLPVAWRPKLSMHFRFWASKK